MTTFGDTLRSFRQTSNDPDRLNRRLTQERLGELIGHEMGDLGFSGAAISDWERGESAINAQDRKVLLALIQVLHTCGGIQTLDQADQLLKAGNYHALHSEEIQKIFGKAEYASPANEQEIPFTLLLVQSIFPISKEEFREIVEKAKEGPPPSWPRILAALLRKITDRFSLSIKTVLWGVVWVSSIWLIGPSLHWPFANRDSALTAIVMYGCATLIIPLLIGALVNTSNNEYWKQQNTASPFLLRLYTYQGAGIGFNLGYFLIFPFCLASYYLNLGHVVWMEIAAATLVLILGNMAAHVVPHNLWLAYKRLSIKDGWIFFIVAFIGPMWGFFFLEYYPVFLTPILGVTIIVLAVMGVIFISAQQAKSRGK
ncbi:MAG: helix-turn-helix domain-containing protein [Anaerolineales bacterium]|nr:helix-turn-helix domain-containing protein [Anaerolineales bacterium]